jgi:hypothetical protein
MLIGQTWLKTIGRLNREDRKMVVTLNGTTGITTVDADVNGVLTGNVTAVSASNIDCSTGNYFTKTINGATAFTFNNVPASGNSFGITLELTVTSGSASWPSEVKWPNDTAPTLSAGKTSLLIFITDDGGSRWRGSSLVDYTT